MEKTDFNQLTWFRVVAEERSFTKAAAKIGVAQSTLSYAIKQLEAGMGIRLLTRTTRNVTTTPAGKRLLDTITPRMAEIEEEIAALMTFRDKPSGSIRLTLSDHALESAVWPKLKPVLRDYPDITVELILDSTFRNIVEEGFDAGVRLGESVEKDMIAVRIGPDWRLVAVASPEYLTQYGMPEHPQDLVRHRCINMRHESAGGLYAWEFEKDGQELRVRVRGQLTFNNSYAMIDAAVSGYGIAYVPDNIVEQHVASGELIQVLDDWSPLFDGYFLYYPSRRQNLPAFKVIIDALRYRG
ncbi:LysR family transcriptional regulator [Ochrobactrum sp. 695/2009]|jgi:DNA-binding transcriptional LysR family regulator|uniref:LysR family transcriptional regulator n=1 Tax=Brucella anthropi TaxID=529 RepID=UPI000C283E3C|nr:LysR family transcriptional regulator [Brucella anthropi]PJR88813.1 LysR family transcriptional regulator [Ochrobactrum sp. 721/2009]PJT16796.1 LysR family transcriptional regulator [Ochrobactrum sp. 720/2009]PJT26617.1 LysR family transcriptional regulator [Ochrobactrum sp. 715/2009]PJT28566.1 LysR family transcriptional regulator [Ochrobactrum sp. 695/2009]PJT36138.1 LysR family transcriptional regulator [Ochrobactrum sp. 689/2009]